MFIRYIHTLISWIYI